MPRDHDRILAVARPRVLLPASGAVWTAAAVLHAGHAPTFGTGLVSATAAAVVWGAQSRSAAKAHKRAKGKDVPKPFPLTGVTATAGAWLTIASAAGPLAGPYDAMTLVWAGGTLVWLRAITRHDLVRQAKEWRWARHRHLSEAHGLGLGGSHLLEHEPTRLGERKVLDTTGTGKLASQIARSDLAERIAQREGLPRSRVSVTEHRIAGRVAIDTRYRDPWAKPIPHPLFDADPEIELPVPCTIREPIAVGQEPNEGALLEMALWDGDGGRTIVAVGRKGSGKTVLNSCVRERVTAAADAELWNINVSKGVEDRDWAPACHRSACGPAEKAKAARMLRELRAIIDERGACPRDTPVFQPTPQDRLIVLNVDEADAARAISPQVRADLDYACTKGRSEGVTVIVYAQRGTSDFIGSVIRSQADLYAIGKVGRRGELMHVAGEMGLTLPDMAAYGEGHAGVWVLAGDSGGWQAGRAFNLRELHDIRAVVASRAAGAARRPEPVLVAAVPVPAAGHQGADPLATYEGDLEVALSPDEHDILARLDANLNRAKRAIAETNVIQSEIEEILPNVDKAALAESTRQRWREVGEHTEIPEDAREPLLKILAGDGTTIRKAAEALKVKPWTMRTWLERLRHEGLVELVGQKRGARWRLAAHDGGDAQ